MKFLIIMYSLSILAGRCTSGQKGSKGTKAENKNLAKKNGPEILAIEEYFVNY